MQQILTGAAQQGSYPHYGHPNAPATGFWAGPQHPQPSAYVGHLYPAAPQHSVNTWNSVGMAPTPATQLPALGRRGVAWIGVGAAALLATTVAAVVGLTSIHGDTQTNAAGAIHVPTPPVKTSPAPQDGVPGSSPSSMPLIGDTDLPALLPPVAHVSALMGASNLEAIDNLSGPGLFNDTTDPARCASAVIPVSKASYARNGVRATYVQSLHEHDRSVAVHTIFNGVSTFNSAAEASAYVNQQISNWEICQGSPITLNPNENSDKRSTWTVQAVATRGGMLTSQISMHGAPTTCHRALTARRNVVIDLVTCSEDGTDIAAPLAAEIADHAGKSA